MAAPEAGASFSIDLAAAPQAISDLKRGRDELYDLLEEARRLGSVVPPAQDQVSRDAATVLGRAAYGGPGCLFDALKAGVDQLTGMINSLEQELEGYRLTEGDNTRTFDGDA